MPNFNHYMFFSPVYQKPANPMSPLVNAVHKPPPVPPVPQRTPSFHPNYANVQSGVPPPAEPAAQNHTFPPPPPAPHPITRPPNPGQNQQWAAPMPNSMDHRPGPGYPHGFEGQPMPSTERVPSYATDNVSGPMSNASSHDSEESRTKVCLIFGLVCCFLELGTAIRVDLLIVMIRIEWLRITVTKYICFV